MTVQTVSRLLKLGWSQKQHSVISGQLHATQGGRHGPVAEGCCYTTCRSLAPEPPLLSSPPASFCDSRRINPAIGLLQSQKCSGKDPIASRLYSCQKRGLTTARLCSSRDRACTQRKCHRGIMYSTYSYRCQTYIPTYCLIAACLHILQ